MVSCRMTTSGGHDTVQVNVNHVNPVTHTGNAKELTAFSTSVIRILCGTLQIWSEISFPNWKFLENVDKSHGKWRYQNANHWTADLLRELNFSEDGLAQQCKAVDINCIDANLLTRGRCRNNSVYFSNVYCQLISSILPVKLILGECHRTRVMAS